MNVPTFVRAESCIRLHQDYKNGTKTPLWNDVLHAVEDTAVGTVKFPAPAVCQDGNEAVNTNMRFWE